MRIIYLIIASLLIFKGFAWEKFHSINGSCSIDFPQKPHFSHKVILFKDYTFISYDLYLSELNQNAICMMIVAVYPEIINFDEQNDALEAFLNGIVSQNNDKKIISADFSEFKDLNSLEFLVQDTDRFFKGRAIIKNEKLYLISMEYDKDIDIEKSFKSYLNSLEFFN